MYIQKFVKGISGKDGEGLRWSEARRCIDDHLGIPSNWLRSVKNYRFDPAELVAELTDHQLDRHVHDYARFGQQSPFISLGAGCVERDVLLSANYMYSAKDTALDFATNAFDHPGVLFYGWVIVALNPTVEVAAVAESIRDLNVYHRWSPYQLEGEITAKVQVPANQIDRIEWWDPDNDTAAPTDVYDNPDYTSPARITNLREFF
jgi:hypothetical protein